MKQNSFVAGIILDDPDVSICNEDQFATEKYAFQPPPLKYAIHYLLENISSKSFVGDGTEKGRIRLVDNTYAVDLLPLPDVMLEKSVPM